MLRFFQVLALLIPCSLSSHGQYYFYNDKYYNSRILLELGISAAAFNCLTDLGGNSGTGKRFIKDINWRNTHLGASVHFSATYEQVFAVGLQLGTGTISASDQVLKGDHSDARHRYERNLQFRSRVQDLLLLAEIHPVPLFGAETHSLFSPYIVGGIGLFRFNPQAKIRDQWVDLQPLSTEGQGFREHPERAPYKLVQLSFPIGFGLKYEPSALVNLRFEVLYRVLLTDYLDDVSTSYIDPDHFYSNLEPKAALLAATASDRSGELRPGVRMTAGAIRGNPGNRDAYFTCSMKLGVYINRKHR